jgi:hypothetical protein
VLFPFIEKHLLNSARWLDKALTDLSQKEEAWFFHKFKKDENIYEKNLKGYDERLTKGDLTKQFPRGLNIHPLTLLLIRAMTAYIAEPDIHYYFWRSYLLFIFWADAIREAAELEGFKVHCLYRLRDPENFAGAMFEVLVAFCLKSTKKFDVAFGDDPPDLIVSAKTGDKYALECKMISGPAGRLATLGKLEYVFSDKVLSFLRNKSLSVFVWWTFDSVPDKLDAADMATISAIRLCKIKTEKAAPSLEDELGEGYGKIVVVDLPEALTLYESETGDPKPPLNWYPPNVKKGGVAYYNRLTKSIDKRIVVPVRTAVHLTQSPSIKKTLIRNLDYARKKQLSRDSSKEFKKVAVIGLASDAANRFKEVKSLVSSYLSEHRELSGIYLVWSPGSDFADSIVDCEDESRTGLNSSVIHMIGVTREGCDNDVPIKEAIVRKGNKVRIECLYRQGRKK